MCKKKKKKEKEKKEKKEKRMLFHEANAAPKRLVGQVYRTKRV
jgi:hypothetical protein